MPPNVEPRPARGALRIFLGMAQVCGASVTVCL